MRRRVAISVIVGLLALYALAGLHQFLPHHAEHGSGDTCPLCILLATPSLAVASPAIQSCPTNKAVLIPVYVPVIASAPRGVLLLRGPPPA
ncbi:MAG: hypothetical protein NTU83_11555 [Candidatus Hydrogenedentes bacterium]|nr:hypothetical protein [Candidatus Hydrogenedentota bacterium]